MQATTLSFANLHNHGALFENVLRARRDSHVTRDPWDLPTTTGVTYDQYDTPQSRWLAVHDDAGRVLAGVRLTPTTARCGIYSYMIKDAQAGLLETIPSGVLDDVAPVEDFTWEVTRGFVVPDLSAHLRQKVMQRTVLQIMRASREEGISRLLALMPSDRERWASRCRLEMAAAGPKVNIVGIEHQAVWIDVSTQLH